MKARDLMVGDWVYDTILKGNTKVEILSLSGIRGDYHDNVWDEKTFEPIPLTAEILEKNGWNDWCEHSTIARSISVLVEYNTNLCIQEIDGQDSMFVQLSHCGAGSFEFRKHLKYVHELQHTFRLVGLNELADNFKV